MHNRDIVLQALRELELSDEQIIENLLMLLDDFEIRAAVYQNRNKQCDPDTATMAIAQSTITQGNKFKK